MGRQVRVWWAPTKDKKRSGYSGMYWPATFIRKSGQNMIQVKYDNGELEELDMASVSPAEVPMKFGGETTRLEVGEFCEVFNNSTTDPAAWVGRVAKVNKKSFLVPAPPRLPSPRHTMQNSLCSLSPRTRHAGGVPLPRRGA